MIKYPYTDFHEMNLDWVLQKVKELQEVYNDIPAELQTIVEKWLEDHPEALLKSFYLEPQMFGAVGDGVNDDTQAFRDMAADANDNSFIVIPDGTYILTADVFCNVDLKMNEGVFPNRKFITRNNTSVLFSQNNMINIKSLDIPTGCNIQAFCYDPVHDVYYVGITDSGNTVQYVYTLNSDLTSVNVTTFNEPGLHLNTMTYDTKHERLLSVRSNGHELIELNLTNATITLIATLPDFIAGMQYDPVLDLYVGITGPNITMTTDWIFRVYDENWNVLKTGTFQNPYGVSEHETPNGFSVYNGLITNSSFNQNSPLFNLAIGVQYIFTSDLFGNTNKVYQTYFNHNEFEGIAFNGKQFMTGHLVYDTKVMIVAIDPNTVFSDSLNKITQRVNLPITWNSTYVDDFVGTAIMDIRNRVVEFSGYIVLKTTVQNDTEIIVATIPSSVSPYGAPKALPATSAGGNVNLTVTGTDLKLVKNTGSGRYINIGGQYTY